MGAMLGLVVSDSFLMFFIFWELTSITSFLLIGFDHEREAARRAALQALVVTGGGGLCLLAGLLLLWNITGVTQMSELTGFGDVVRESPLYLAALILVLGGAFTKSAQFPFHFWLPNAMVLMTALYLAAGEIARRGGGFLLSTLGGLYRQSGGFTALSLVLFLAACGLPPFSGFWPKVILVKAALDSGAWWLAAVILAGGFLTTIAFGRLFLLAYWRPAPMAAKPAAALWGTGFPLAALTALVVGFGILPEQLLALSQSAAAGLADPEAYLHSVFPGGGAP